MTSRNRTRRKAKSALSSQVNNTETKLTGPHGWDPDHYDGEVRKVAFLTDEVLNYIYSRSTPEHKALIKILELANEAKHAGCLSYVCAKGSPNGRALLKQLNHIRILSLEHNADVDPILDEFLLIFSRSLRTRSALLQLGTGDGQGTEGELTYGLDQSRVFARFNEWFGQGCTEMNVVLKLARHLPDQFCMTETAALANETLSSMAEATALTPDDENYLTSGSLANYTAPLDPLAHSPRGKPAAADLASRTSNVESATAEIEDSLHEQLNVCADKFQHEFHFAVQEVESKIDNGEIPKITYPARNLPIEEKAEDTVTARVGLKTRAENLEAEAQVQRDQAKQMVVPYRRFEILPANSFTKTTDLLERLLSELTSLPSTVTSSTTLQDRLRDQIVTSSIDVSIIGIDCRFDQCKSDLDSGSDRLIEEEVKSRQSNDFLDDPLFVRLVHLDNLWVEAALACAAVLDALHVLIPPQYRPPMVTGLNDNSDPLTSDLPIFFLVPRDPTIAVEDPAEFTTSKQLNNKGDLMNPKDKERVDGKSVLVVEGQLDGVGQLQPNWCYIWATDFDQNDYAIGIAVKVKVLKGSYAHTKNKFLWVPVIFEFEDAEPADVSERHEVPEDVLNELLFLVPPVQSATRVICDFRFQGQHVTNESDDDGKISISTIMREVYRSYAESANAMSRRHAERVEAAGKLDAEGKEVRDELRNHPGIMPRQAPDPEFNGPDDDMMSVTTTMTENVDPLHEIFRLQSKIGTKLGSHAYLKQLELLCGKGITKERLLSVEKDMKGRFKENKKGIEEKVNKAIERWKQFLSEDLKSNCSTEAQGATVNTTEADLSSLINEFDIPVDGHDTLTHHLESTVSSYVGSEGEFRVGCMMKARDLDRCILKCLLQEQLRDAVYTYYLLRALNVDADKLEKNKEKGKKKEGDGEPGEGSSSLESIAEIPLKLRSTSEPMSQENRLQISSTVRLAGIDISELDVLLGLKNSFKFTVCAFVNALVKHGSQISKDDLIHHASSDVISTLKKLMKAYLTKEDIMDYTRSNNNLVVELATMTALVNKTESDPISVVRRICTTVNEALQRPEFQSGIETPSTEVRFDCRASVKAAVEAISGYDITSEEHSLIGFSKLVKMKFTEVLNSAKEKTDWTLVMSKSAIDKKSGSSKKKGSVFGTTSNNQLDTLKYLTRSEAQTAQFDAYEAYHKANTPNFEELKGKGGEGKGNKGLTCCAAFMTGKDLCPLTGKGGRLWAHHQYTHCPSFTWLVNNSPSYLLSMAESSTCSHCTQVHKGNHLQQLFLVLVTKADKSMHLGILNLGHGSPWSVMCPGYSKQCSERDERMKQKGGTGHSKSHYNVIRNRHISNCQLTVYGFAGEMETAIHLATTISGSDKPEVLDYAKVVHDGNKAVKEYWNSGDVTAFKTATAHSKFDSDGIAQLVKRVRWSDIGKSADQKFSAQMQRKDVSLALFDLGDDISDVFQSNDGATGVWANSTATTGAASSEQPSPLLAGSNVASPNPQATSKTSKNSDILMKAMMARKVKPNVRKQFDLTLDSIQELQYEDCPEMDELLNDEVDVVFMTSGGGRSREKMTRGTLIDCFEERFAEYNPPEADPLGGEN